MSGKKSGLRPFTPQSAPRNGRVKGSRNQTPPKKILQAIVEHACEAYGKERIPRLKLAMNMLFKENPGYYVKAVSDASVRLAQLEQGSQLGDDGQPVTLIVRWGAPRQHASPPMPEVIEPQPYVPPPAGPAMTQPSPRLLTLLPRPPA